MSSKKNEKKTKVKKESFIYKYKNDKKYKAKVELTSYVIFILVIMLFINISSMGNASPNNNLTNEIIQNNNMNNKLEKSILENINNNYQYDINVNLIKTTDKIIDYHYYGKSYNDTLEINKDSNGIINTYYKVDDYYYKMEDQNYIFATKEEIYDLISSDYIEINKLLEYIDESSLDHVTNYSSGKKEYVYTLYLRNIIINNKTEEVITINIIEENGTLNINVDYTNLIKLIDNTVKECKINYIFSNIDKIDKFFTLEEKNGDINE